LNEKSAEKLTGKDRILFQDRGGARFKTAGNLLVVKDMKRGTHEDMGPKDIFDMIKGLLNTRIMDDRIHQSLISLDKSAFRSKFRLTQKDCDYVAAKGLGTIKDHACQFVKLRIAPDFPRNDGKQTPMKGHPVFIAQHATATCCRGCIQKWHKINKGRALNEEEVDFIVSLIMAWIMVQICKTKK